MLIAKIAKVAKVELHCKTIIQITLLQQHVYYGSRENVKATTLRYHSRQPSPEPCALSKILRLSLRGRT